jgi:hypothetical protein
MNTLDHPAQAQKPVTGNGAHFGFDEQPGLGAGVGCRHAIGEQDALGQLADVLDRDQHRSNIL